MLKDQSISPLAISLSILMTFSRDFVWILIDFGQYLDGTEVFYHLYIYRKIPKTSPRAYIFQRPFLRGLSMEGSVHFKIDWASLIVGSREI